MVFVPPDYAHIPGANDRHEEGFLDHITEKALVPTASSSAKSNAAWGYGLELMGAGFYWEAHEVLEQVWLNALSNSREKALVQGIIHVANAALKIKMQRKPAALRLANLARDSFQRAWGGTRKDQIMGLSYEDMVAATHECCLETFKWRHAS